MDDVRWLVGGCRCAARPILPGRLPMASRLSRAVLCHVSALLRLSVGACLRRSSACGSLVLAAALASAPLLGRRRPSAAFLRLWPCPSRRCLAGLFGDQRQRFLDGHRLRILALRQRRVDLAPVDIGAVAAVANGDCATIRMVAEFLQRCRRAAAAPPGALPCLFGNHASRRG